MTTTTHAGLDPITQFGVDTVITEEFMQDWQITNLMLWAKATEILHSRAPEARIDREEWSGPCDGFHEFMPYPVSHYHLMLTAELEEPLIYTRLG